MTANYSDLHLNSQLDWKQSQVKNLSTMLILNLSRNQNTSFTLKISFLFRQQEIKSLMSKMELQTHFLSV